MKNFIICGYAPYTLYQIELESFDKENIAECFKRLPHSYDNPCVIVMTDYCNVQYESCKAYTRKYKHGILSYELTDPSDEVIFVFDSKLVELGEDDDEEYYEKYLSWECEDAEKTIINKIKENENEK